MLSCNYSYSKLFCLSELDTFVIANILSFLHVAVMRKFNHPHIIKLYGVLSHGAATYIIMELAPLGQVSGCGLITMVTRK